MARSNVRPDYKKTPAPKPAQVKKLNIVSYAKMGKAVNSGSQDIFHMGKK
jgi:hypothetical protein